MGTRALQIQPRDSHLAIQSVPLFGFALLTAVRYVRQADGTTAEIEGRLTLGDEHAVRLRVGIIVTQQFTLNAFANFVDVLRLAGDEGDRSGPIRCQWHVMSATGGPVRSSCGVLLTPTSPLKEYSDLHYIAVIGGLLYRGRPIDPRLRSYLLAADASGIGLLGICTGSFVLCRLGLMKGKKCCVSWYHHRDFVEEFQNTVAVADELYVTQGNRITSAGGIGAAYVAAHLVKRHLGSDPAHKALHIMQMPGSTTNLQPAPPLAPACKDGRVSRALLMMERTIGKPVSIDEIAKRLAISKRTLERLFDKHSGQAPKTVYLHLRLRHAREMLRSQMPLHVIAQETGFAGTSHFCATFKRAYGHVPSEERLRLEESPGSGLSADRLSRCPK